MPLDALDSAAAYSFTFTVDGIEVPKSMDISGLKAEVDKISHNQQTSDGKFITRQLIGRQKAGTFTVTRGLTDSATITDWLKVVMEGDIAGARKTAEVGVERRDVGVASLPHRMLGQEVVGEPGHAGVSEHGCVREQPPARRPVEVVRAVDEIRRAEGVRCTVPVPQAQDRHR